jgi:tRNA(Ile)-lysidine synthase
MALLWLAARWRAALKQGPKLIAVTVDHGLRAEAAREARGVKAFAASLGIAHRTVKWTGPKPSSGIQDAARAARYRLLAKAATAAGATHLLTAHTQDDQAETVLMRLARGSGVAGLAAMAVASRRAGVIVARPLLAVPKARLVATLTKAGVVWADDRSNRDPRFARVRWRALMPGLAAEGLDAAALARFAARIARANAALDAATDAAQAALAHAAARSFAWRIDRAGFACLPEEIRLRFMARALAAVGDEGPVELGKLERLMEALTAALTGSGRFKRTLAGAAVALEREVITVTRTPKRRSPAKSS